MASQSNKRVLIVGGDVIGAATAKAIAMSGYKVALATGSGNSGATKVYGFNGEVPIEQIEKEVADNADIEVLQDMMVDRVNGFAGGYEVCLSADNATTTQTVDAIVLASPLAESPKQSVQGLENSSAVLSQDELYEKLQANAAEMAEKSIVFLYGLSQESNPVVMRKTINIIEAANQTGAQVYMFSDNLKVASDGLDARLGDLRDSKCILVKSIESPSFTQTDTDIEVVYNDATLRMPVTIHADYVVVDSVYTANPRNSKLAEALSINLDPNQFLQTDNVYNISVLTTKTGVFAVGPAKGIRSFDDSLEDVNNVILELDKLFNQALDENRPVAVVDPDKCVICLTCYRSCQHGAIAWKDSAAVVDPLSCQACGMCAAECPMNAIQVTGYSDADISSQLEGIDTSSKEMVAFCCKNSATQAIESAELLDAGIAANLKVIEIPCAGKMDTEHIMEAFQNGADGVMVLGCHMGNCKSEKGNAFAKRRIADLQTFLAASGIPENKLIFNTIASNMGIAFVNMIKQIKSN